MKFISGLMAFIFAVGSVGSSYAQGVSMSAPGTRVSLSASFAPPLLKGVKVYPDNPFRLDFILDRGDSSSSTEQLKSETTRLIKYFLASITVPEKDLWVNLSPYEKDRIVPVAFGVTEMGRDLLAQDYMLKQITASVIYPEGDVGKAFWAKVYAEAQKRYGTSDVPVDTFNKVWIVPEKAVVYETKDSAYVVESKLKVMLEEDYLALEKNTIAIEQTTPATNKLGSDIVREVVIPILEKEVNEGMNFAQLRQVYQSLILAVWYKDKVKESVFGKAYSDQKKTSGVDIADKAAKDKIWAQYVEAFKKGAYNYIKEDIDPETQQTVPRKYFSGGVGFDGGKVRAVKQRAIRSQLSGRGSDNSMVVKANLKPVDYAQEPAESLKGSTKERDLVATDASVDEKIRSVLMNYELGTTQHEEVNFEMLPGVLTRAPIKITTPHGIFVVKQIGNNLQEAIFTVSIIRRLSEAGFPLPHVWKRYKTAGDKTEDYFFQIGQKFYLMEDFIDGKVVAPLFWTLEQMHAIGKSLAQIHNTLGTASGEGARSAYLITHVINIRPDVIAFRRIIERKKSAEQTRGDRLFLDIVDQMLEQWDVFEKNLPTDWYQSLPRYVVHGDMALPNVIFDDSDQVKAVLDWERARMAPRLEDFKNPIVGLGAGNGWSYNYDKLRNLVLGYQEETKEPLSDQELKAIPEVIRGTFLWNLASVFLLQRDKLNDDSYYQSILSSVDAFKQLIKDFPGTPISGQEFIDSLKMSFSASKLKTNGGIDLTQDKMGGKIQRLGDGVQFKFDLAMIQQLQSASGLTPVIIDIRPMTTSVPVFLGLKDDGQVSSVPALMK